MKKTLLCLLTIALVCSISLGLTSCDWLSNLFGGDDASNDNVHEHAYVSEVTNPTCTSKGFTTYTCSCGDSYTVDIDFTGHSYTSVVTPPTCTKQGYTKHTCSACKDTYTDDHKHPTEHNYTATVTPSTCIALGYTTYTCKCGDTYEVKENAYADHTKIHVTTDPTCKTGGYTEEICAECGTFFAILNSTEPTDQHVWESASCDDYGYCAVCGTLSDVPLGHDFVDGYCSRCNTEFFTVGLTFTLSDDNSHYIVEDLTGFTGSELVIPATHYGLPVTAVRENAFSGCTSLKSVYLKGALASIGKNAFNGCNNIENVYVKDLTVWCAIEFENNVSNPLWYAKNLYADGELVTDLVIPESVTSIPKHAFHNYAGLTSVIIPANVTTINDYAFYSCVNLESIYLNATNMSDLASNNRIFHMAGQNADSIFVYIGEDVKCIPAYLFMSCEKLTTVTFAENSNCERIGDYAFATCDQIANIALPGSLVSIGNYSFADCSALTGIALPDNLNAIGDNAFCNCISLTSITINTGLKTIGQYAFAGCTSVGEITFNAIAMDDLKNNNNAFANIGTEISGVKLTFGDSVTKIPAYAFKNCITVTKVTIGESVKSIGVGAFNGCKYISEIAFNAINMNDLTADHNIFENVGAETDGVYLVIGNSVKKIPAYAFNNSNAIVNVTIGESVKHIGNYAFNNCDSIATIEFNAIATNDLHFDNNAFANVCNENGVSLIIGSNVTKIPAYMFNSNIKLTSVVFTNNDVCVSVGNYAFANSADIVSVNLPDSVTTIGAGAFADCPALTSVVMNNVTEIGKYAFAHCSALTDIELPENLTSLGNYAFDRCIALTEVTVNNNLYAIPDYAFLGCSALTTVTLGSNVKEIGEYAFYDCAVLSKIMLNDSVESIKSYAFYGCADLKNVTGANNVTYVGSYAFTDCSSLEGISIPKVEAINDYTFSGCVNLKNANISSATVVGDSAFCGCSAMTSVTLSDTLTSIGNYAFKMCSSVASVKLPETLKSCGIDAFYGCESLKSVKISDLGAWCSITFDGYFSNPIIYGAKLYLDDEVVKNIDATNLPETVTEISSYAFYNYKELVSVIIPESIISIGDSAFRNCSELKNVTIGKNVESIGVSAFEGCSITSITFADTAGWWYTSSPYATSGNSMNVSNQKISEWDNYYGYYWRKG